MSERKRPQIDEVTLLRGWSEWNSKSLSDYLEAILQLSPEERKKDRGASYGSIQNIFLHIIEDYIWWFECVPQQKPDEFQELVGHDLSEEEIRSLVLRVDRSIRSMEDSIKLSDLGNEIQVKGTSGNGKPYTMTTCLADIMWHMVEEQLQHIGEINALFWQMNIDPPTHAWFSSNVSHTF